MEESGSGMGKSASSSGLEASGSVTGGIDWGRRGLVFDIRRFSTHDGPGIRTAVFTKGCPLRCRWCQNPEGIELKRNLLYFRDKCIGCGTCIQNCPRQAIRRDGEKIAINREACDLCGRCVDVCPPLALAFDSREMTVREVVDEIMLDRGFFHGDGGVTISGGDPVAQHAFHVEILKACRAEGIHTAIETSLHAAPEIIQAFLPHLSLLIADFKAYDCTDHEAWTGVPNERIKENFRMVIRRLAALRDSAAPADKAGGRSVGGSGMATAFELLVRIPLIPGHTATEENLRRTGAFFLELDAETRIELLNYNPLAAGKYRLIGQEFLFAENPRLYTPSELAGFVRILTDMGVHAFSE